VAGSRVEQVVLRLDPGQRRSGGVEPEVVEDATGHRLAGERRELATAAGEAQILADGAAERLVERGLHPSGAEVLGGHAAARGLAATPARPLPGRALKGCAA